MESQEETSGRASRGVYFLANDEMYEFTIAFLNSFRKYNPDVPLCMIPFNNDFKRIEQLKDSYGFTVFPDSRLLMECSELSLALHERVAHEYRKLAIWEGIFDEFIYIDIDTVVLDDVSFLFGYLPDYWFLAGTSNIPECRKFVWLEGVENTGMLDAEQIAFAANTGFMVSKKGYMDLEYAKQKMTKARLLEDYMAFVCREQPFLNYLVVTSGKPYTSLTVLASSEKKRKVMIEYWGGETAGKVEGGKLHIDGRKPVLFIHWAGVWRLREKMPNRKIWNYYRNMTLTDAGPSANRSKKGPLRLFSSLFKAKLER